MRKIKKNIAYVNFSKYSKFMRDFMDPNKVIKEAQENSQFSEGGVYVREDDQDWGSSGMNDIQKESK